MNSQPQDAIAEIRKRLKPTIERIRLVAFTSEISEFVITDGPEAEAFANDLDTLLGEVLRLTEAKRAWDIAIEETLTPDESAEVRAAALEAAAQRLVPDTDGQTPDDYEDLGRSFFEEYNDVQDDPAMKDFVCCDSPVEIISHLLNKTAEAEARAAALEVRINEATALIENCASLKAIMATACLKGDVSKAQIAARELRRPIGCNICHDAAHWKVCTERHCPLRENCQGNVI